MVVQAGAGEGSAISDGDYRSQGARVVPDAEFSESVLVYASQLASGAPVAHALTKRLLARSLDTPLDAALRDELVYIKQCFATTDVGEAIAAFREKRRPTFKGK